MKTKQQKIETVRILQEKLGRAKAMVFTDYKGLSMKHLSDLRNGLRDQNAEFSVTKNTLLKIALPKEYKLPDATFEGPIATLFAYDDEISPIKLLVKALKDSAIGKIKIGFLGTQLLSEVRINQMAQLPTKDELRGQTVGLLAAPLQGIVGVLQGNLRNLVYALSEIQKTKGVNNS